MKPDMFAVPVTILTGLGNPTPVSSASDAYRLLLDWPTLQQDPAHTIAVKACKAAMAGQIEAETARSVFAAFADKHDLLAPDLSLVMAGRNRRAGDPYLP